MSLLTKAPQSSHEEQLRTPIEKSSVGPQVPEFLSVPAERIPAGLSVPFNPYWVFTQNTSLILKLYTRQSQQISATCLLATTIHQFLTSLFIYTTLLPVSILPKIPAEMDLLLGHTPRLTELSRSRAWLHSTKASIECLSTSSTAQAKIPRSLEVHPGKALCISTLTFPSVLHILPHRKVGNKSELPLCCSVLEFPRLCCSLCSGIALQDLSSGISNDTPALSAPAGDRLFATAEFKQPQKRQITFTVRLSHLIMKSIIKQATQVRMHMEPAGNRGEKQPKPCSRLSRHSAAFSSIPLPRICPTLT